MFWVFLRSRHFQLCIWPGKKCIQRSRSSADCPRSEKKKSSVFRVWSASCCIEFRVQWRIYIVKFLTRAPRSIFFQFHAVFGTIWQNGMLAPPGLAPPPRGNPGSATGVCHFLSITHQNLHTSLNICYLLKV